MPSRGCDGPFAGGATGARKFHRFLRIVKQKDPSARDCLQKLMTSIATGRSRAIPSGYPGECLIWGCGYALTFRAEDGTAVFLYGWKSSDPLTELV